MEVNMAELSKELKESMAKEVETTLTETANDFRQKLEARLENETQQLLHFLKARLLSVAIAVVAAVVFLLVTTMYLQTTRVNSSVIALQDKILGAQDRIQNSTKALQDAENNLGAAEAKLKIAMEQLDQKRAEYDTLLKQMQSAQAQRK